MMELQTVRIILAATDTLQHRFQGAEPTTPLIAVVLQESQLDFLLRSVRRRLASRRRCFFSSEYVGSVFIAGLYHVGLRCIALFPGPAHGAVCRQSLNLTTAVAAQPRAESAPIVFVADVRNGHRALDRHVRAQCLLVVGERSCHSSPWQRERRASRSPPDRSTSRSTTAREDRSYSATAGRVAACVHRCSFAPKVGRVRMRVRRSRLRRAPEWPERRHPQRTQRRNSAHTDHHSAVADFSSKAHRR